MQRLVVSESNSRNARWLRRFHLHLQRLGVIAGLSVTLACGFADKEKSNNRHRADAAQGNDDSAQDGTHSIGGVDGDGPLAGGSTGAATPGAKSDFDESFNRASGAIYYQRTPELKDLFANGTSLLCWPSALAYQFDYQKNKRSPAYDKLRPLSDNAAAKQVSTEQQIRYLTNLCGVDTKVGTYPSQATACISKFYRSSGYTPDVGAIGPIVSGEHFADDVSLFDRPIAVADLRRHIKADRALIAMVGFFKKTADNKWKRVNGHFVSITGYDYQFDWAETKIALQIVNPDTNYLERATDNHFDQVFAQRLSDAYMAKFPAGATLQLIGEGFGQAEGDIALLERLIVFKAK